MAQYTYLVADLLGGRILDELPLSGVSFGKALNDAGSFRGQLAVRDPRIRARDPYRLLQPARTALYVDRDGVLVWGGVLWTTRYNGSDGIVEVRAADFLSYFEHRLVLPYPLPDPVAPAAVTFTAADQLAVARELVDLAQRHAGGDLGVVVSGPQASGVQVTVTYHGYDMKSVAEALRDLAEQEAGFDFVLDAGYDAAGRPERRLLLGHPRLGSATTPHVWEYGANLVGFSWPRDGTELANRVFVQGPGDEADRLIATAAAPTPAGWPLLEDSAARLDVADQARLAAYAQAELAARSRPTVLPELSVRADRDPVLGGYNVGDDARILIEDPYFPTQMDAVARIIAVEVSPGDEGGREQVTLTVSPVQEPI